MRLGIDFGTTNSAVTLYDGDRLHTAQMDDGSRTLPSLLYITRQQETIVGLDAGLEYLRRETGRSVRWRTRPIGTIQIMVAGTGGSPIVYDQEISVTYDDAAFGRLLQSVKTVLRQESYDGTQIFDRYYTVDMLIERILHHLKTSAEAQFGQRVDTVVIGRPVKFSDDPYLDRRAEEIIYKAAWAAGFEEITFQMEPVGALYLYHVAQPQRRRVLVFDFGGGTLDLTIAEVGGGSAPNILATRGVLVGGDDLDRRIMGALMKYFGEDPERGETLPLDIAAALGSWQSMPDISYPHYTDVFNTLRHTHKRPETIDALQTLVSRNVGYSLFRQIEQVKRQLTTHDAAALQFRYENIHIDETITRARFERLIRREIDAADEGIRQVLADAHVAPAQIDTVVRTGGSSLVPAFIDLLARHFGAEKLVEIDPLLSVAGGLGILAHENRGIAGSYRARYLRDPRRAIGALAPHSAADLYLMRVGERAYTDRDTTVRKIPVALSALPAVRLPNTEREHSADSYLTLTLTARSKVYVAYPSMASSVPHWLREYTLQPGTVEVSDDWWGTKELHLYGRWCDAGDVTIGAASAEGAQGRVDMNLLVLVEPDTTH